uniref:SPRY domain-containing protein n=1 Tax=Glossina brevipalpis TaxID=37001 RepID=A0A1A9X1N4_9MUSC
MFCCLRTCLNGNVHKPSVSVSRVKEPDIHLDSLHMGPDVILLSNYIRITGRGGALATAPLVQSKSYFEVKIQQGGNWSVGLATRKTDLSRKQGGTDCESWCLCSDNITRHNNEECEPVRKEQISPNSSLLNESTAPGLIGIEDLNEDLLLTTGSLEGLDNKLTNGHFHDSPTIADEGDVIGVSFNHIELNFYVNGKNLEVPFRNIKGNTLYPVIYVGNGAILDIILENFLYPIPGFERIMLEQSLL